MPWTAQQFKDRHWKNATPAQANRAAALANAMLKSGVDEGTSISTAIKRAKINPAKHGLEKAGPT